MATVKKTTTKKATPTNKQNVIMDKKTTTNIKNVNDQNSKLEEVKEAKSSKKSIIVQVDKETEMLLKTIRNSIAGELSESINSLEEKLSGDKQDEALLPEIKKVTKRLDSIEEQLDDLSTTMKSLSQKIDSFLAINK